MEPIIMSALVFCMLYGPTCEPCPYIRDGDTTLTNSSSCCCKDAEIKDSEFDMVEINND